MDDIESPAALRRLAELSLVAMLGRGVVVVEHPHGWKRPSGWPLPIERSRNQGAQTQRYRPFVILAYVDGALERLSKPPKDDWSDLV